MKTARYLIASIFAACACSATLAQEAAPTEEYHRSAPVVKKSTILAPAPEFSEMVRVGNDTLPVIIPQKNYGRYDRGLFNWLYIPKGSWAFGMTASYGEFNTEDVQVLSMMKDIDFKGKIYSVKPTISYFFRSNEAVGLRFDYSRGIADLANLSVDFDEDINFSLHDVAYHTESFKLGLFYRYYVGLDRSRRFSVFNEVSLDFGTGTSNFRRYYNDILYDTHTKSTLANLNFSPGVCVFIQDYVAFNVSFGVFGVKLNKEKQTTNGIDEGSRFSSGANFKFNIFNINFGLMVVI